MAKWIFRPSASHPARDGISIWGIYFAPHVETDAPESMAKKLAACGVFERCANDVPVPQSIEDDEVTPTLPELAKRGRGRPKGSKNKPKS